MNKEALLAIVSHGQRVRVYKRSAGVITGNLAAFDSIGIALSDVTIYDSFGGVHPGEGETFIPWTNVDQVEPVTHEEDC